MGQKRVESMKHPEIQRDIERTRAEMSGTIGEIEARLSPAHLREQIMEQVEIAKDSFKAQLKEEMGEAKVHLREGLMEAKETVKTQIKEELRDAKEGVKQEIREVKGEIRQEYQEAKAAVRAATIGKVETMVQVAGDKMTGARTTIVDTIRENPIPAALIGVGLVWMIMGASSRRSTSSNDNRIGVVDRGQRVLGTALHRVEDATSGVVHKVRDASLAAGQAVGSVAVDAKDTVADLAHRAGDTVGDLAHRAGDTVGTLATQTQQTARQTARRVGDGFENTMRDNPLALGAAAFAIGTAVGLAIPSTQREDALLGEVRDQLLEKAQSMAHDAVATAQEKVTEALVGQQGGADKKTSDTKSLGEGRV